MQKFLLVPFEMFWGDNAVNWLFVGIGAVALLFVIFMAVVIRVVIKNKNEENTGPAHGTTNPAQSPMSVDPDRF